MVVKKKIFPHVWQVTCLVEPHSLTHSLTPKEQSRLMCMEDIKDIMSDKKGEGFLPPTHELLENPLYLLSQNETI